MSGDMENSNERDILTNYRTEDMRTLHVVFLDSDPTFVPYGCSDQELLDRKEERAETLRLQ
jgi:hypothetical protein